MGMGRKTTMSQAERRARRERIRSLAQQGWTKARLVYEFDLDPYYISLICRGLLPNGKTLSPAAARVRRDRYGKRARKMEKDQEKQQGVNLIAAEQAFWSWHQTHVAKCDRYAGHCCPHACCHDRGVAYMELVELQNDYWAYVCCGKLGNNYNSLGFKSNPLEYQRKA